MSIYPDWLGQTSTGTGTAGPTSISRYTTLELRAGETLFNLTTPATEFSLLGPATFIDIQET